MSQLSATANVKNEKKNATIHTDMLPTKLFTFVLIEEHRPFPALASLSTNANNSLVSGGIAVA